MALLAQGPDVKVEFETPPAPPTPPPPTLRPLDAKKKAQQPPPEAKEAGKQPAPTVTGRVLLERAAEELLGARETAAAAPPADEAAAAPPAHEAAAPRTESESLPPPPGPDRTGEQMPAFGEAPTPTEGGTARSADTYRGPSALKMVFGLAVVLAGVVGLLYFIRRFYYGGLAPSGASGVMEVLGREHVAPGRLLLLVRVGKRLLVLASTREGLSRVAEISDNEEVEEILRTVGQNTRRQAFADLLKTVDRRPGAPRSIDLTDEDGP